MEWPLMLRPRTNGKPVKKVAETSQQPEAPAASQSQLTKVGLMIGKAEYEVIGGKFLQANAWASLRDMRRDAVLSSALELKTYIPMRADYNVEPASESAEHKRQAEFVKYALDAMDIYGVIRKALDAVAIGFSVQEKVWTVCKEGEWAGLMYPSRTIAHDPQNISFQCDDFWTVQEIKVTVPGKSYLTPYPVGRFIYWVYGQVYEHPYGHGDFLEAYRAWFIKNEVLKLWVQFLERNAAGFRKVTYGKGATPEQQDQIYAEIVKPAAMTGIMLPEGTEFEYIDTTTEGQSFERCLQWCDMQLARAVLGSALAVDEGQRVGSKAMATVHMGVAYEQSAQLARLIERQIVGKQIIEQMIRANFAGETEFPRFILSQPNPAEMAALSERVSSAIDRGILDPGEPWIRPELGFKEDTRTPQEKKKAADERRQVAIDTGLVTPKAGIDEVDDDEEEKE